MQQEDSKLPNELVERKVKNPYSYEIQTRFVDTDRLGHINNAVYATYLELARTYWHQMVKKGDLKHFDWILGSISIKFIREAVLGDKLRIYMWASHIGNRSWEFSYGIYNQRDELITQASSKQIGFDYDTRTSASIAQDICMDLRSRCGGGW